VINLEPIGATWTQVGTWLSNPNVVFLLIIFVAASGILFILIPWLFKRYLNEITDRLMSDHDRQFRAKGIPQRSLNLIALCLAWVFCFKLCAELVVPFVAMAAPLTGERFLILSHYDWVVLVASMLLVTSFWLRFLLDVKRHDSTKEATSKIDRNLGRTFPLFWKPAVFLLALMFLPDFGKRVTNATAEVMKAQTLIQERR
jgi:hypothetical protein